MLTKFKMIVKTLYEEFYFKLINFLDRILYSKMIFKAKDTKYKYDIYVKENLFFKSLFINNTKIIQSKLYKKEPSRLSLTTSQVLIIPTILHQNPEDILIVGLGGGDLIRYYNKFSPDSKLTVIEKSNAIINAFNTCFNQKNNIATQNNILKDRNLDIINDDFFNLISDTKNLSFEKKYFDSIIFDGFIEKNNFNLINRKSLNLIFQKLNENGIISFNFLFPDNQKFLKTLTIFQNYFKDNILIIYGKDINNIIIVACKNSYDSNYFNQLERLNIIKNLHFKKEYGFIAEYC